MTLTALVPNDVPSERAKNALFTAMIDGYRDFMRARNCVEAYVTQSCGMLRRFQADFGWPWEWETAIYDRWQSKRIEDGIALSTRRGNQHALDGFTRYICDPDYPWVERCTALVGIPPRRIITDANRLLHKEAKESGEHVRPATRIEIQKLFDYIDACTDGGTSHRALTAYRDGLIIRMAYAYGLRRSEAVGILAGDFNRNVHAPEHGHFGSVFVRNGKAKPCGPKRVRTIFTSQIMRWIVPELERYVNEVRVCFQNAENDGHLFLANHGGVLSPGYASLMFRTWADEAGLDRAITIHSLRRSFATHHVEAGYEAAGISRQMGHEWESSTAEYTYLSGSFIQQTFLDAQAFLGDD